jgi:2-C-methyl-D-erythritol 4-phosphate cytidylyltransferase
MSRRPASFTQADVARVLRAAKQVGAASVEVKVGDTTVIVSLDGKTIDDQSIVRL